MASIASNDQKVPSDIRLHLPGMDPLLFNLQFQDCEQGGSILMTAENQLTKDIFRSVITESSLRQIGITRKCRLLLNMLLTALQGQKPDEFTLTLGYLSNPPNMADHESKLVVPSKSSLRLTGHHGHPLLVIIDRITPYDEEIMWFILEPVEQNKVDRLEAMLRDRQREIVALQVALAQAQEMMATLQTKVNTEIEAHQVKMETKVMEMEARMADFMTQMENKMAKSARETENNMANFMAQSEAKMAKSASETETNMANFMTQIESKMASTASETETKMANFMMETETNMAKTASETESDMARFITNMEVKMNALSEVVSTNMAKTASEAESKMARFMADMELKMNALSDVASTPMVGMWTTNDEVKQGTIKWNIPLLFTDHPDFLQLELHNARFVSPKGGVYEIDMYVCANVSVSLHVDGKNVRSCQFSRSVDPDPDCHFCMLELHEVIRLNAGQYFEFDHPFGYGSLNEMGTGVAYHKLTIKKL